MGVFTARIVAVLDTKALEQKMAAIQQTKKEIKIGVNLDENFEQKIQAKLNRKAFNANVALNIGNIGELNTKIGAAVSGKTHDVVIGKITGFDEAMGKAAKNVRVAISDVDVKAENVQTALQTSLDKAKPTLKIDKIEISKEELQKAIDKAAPKATVKIQEGRKDTASSGGAKSSASGGGSEKGRQQDPKNLGAMLDKLTDNGTIDAVIAKITGKVNKIFDSMGKLVSGFDMDEMLPDGTKVENYVSKLKKVQEALEEIRQYGEIVKDPFEDEMTRTEALGNMQSSIKALTNNLTVLSTAMANVDSSTGNMMKKLNQGLADGTIGASVDKISNSFTALSSTLSALGEGSEIDNIRSQMADIGQEIERIKGLQTMLEAGTGASGGKLSAEQMVTVYEQMNDVIKRVSASMNNAKTAAGQFAKEADVATAKNKMEIWLTKNADAAFAFGGKVRELIGQLEEMGAQGGVTKTGLAQISAEFKQIDADATKAGLKGKAAVEDLGESAAKTTKSLSENLKQLASRFFNVYTIINFLKQGVQSVTALDAALVDLKKTTTATDTQLNKFYYSANGVAKQLGVTTEAVIQSAAEWSRLGYSIKDAETMSKVSSVFASISPGMDIDAATDGLVSAMKAFNISANDALDGIASKINAIGNSQAVSNNDIVEFLVRSSSAMKEANNTLEETIALGTAATEVTRDAMGVGNALKTISMRIRGYDEETEEFIGGIEKLSGDIADLTKTAAHPEGISLFSNASKTEYKSTYQLLKDISEIYDELTDKQQAELLEKLAGKRQGQVIAAILNNFGAVESSLDTMANSAGNAEAEMSKIEESIEFKMNALKETVTGIYQNLFKTDEIGEFITSATKVLEILQKITDILGTFGSAEVLGALVLYISQFKKLAALGVTAADSTLGKGLVTKIKQVIPLLKGDLTKAVNAVKNSFKGLKAEILANPLLAVAAAAAAVITAFFQINRKIKESREEAEQMVRDNAAELKNDYTQGMQSNQSDEKTLKGLSKEYEQLAKGVDDYGNNISLTTDEYTRYCEIVQTVLGITPQLIEGYDSEGNAIANKNNLIERSIELMEQERKARLESYVGTGARATAFAGFRQEYKDLEEDNNAANLGVKGGSDFVFSHAYGAETTERVLAERVADAMGESADDAVFLSDFSEDILRPGFWESTIAPALQGTYRKNGYIYQGMNDEQIGALKEYIEGLYRQKQAEQAKTDAAAMVVGNFPVPESAYGTKPGFIRKKITSADIAEDRAWDAVGKVIGIDTSGYSNFGKMIGYNWDEVMANIVEIGNEYGKEKTINGWNYPATGEAEIKDFIVWISEIGDLSAERETEYRDIEGMTPELPDILRNMPDPENGAHKTLDEIIGKTIERVVQGIAPWEDNTELWKYVLDNYDAIAGSSTEIWSALKSGSVLGDENGIDLTYAPLTDEQMESFTAWFEEIGRRKKKNEAVNNDFQKYLQVIPQLSDGYDSLSRDTIAFLNQWIEKNFNIDENTRPEEMEQMARSVLEFTNRITSDKGLQETIANGMKIRNGGGMENLTVAEYREALADVSNQIDLIPDQDTRNLVKVTLGIDLESSETDEAQLGKEIETKVSAVKAKVQGEFADEIDGLTLEDIEIAYEISASPGSMTFEELEAAIAESKAESSKVSFSTYFEYAKKNASSMEKLQKTMQGMGWTGSISADDFNSAELRDFAGTLEFVNGMYRLNAESVRELSQAKAAEAIAQNDANKAAAQSEYMKNAKEIRRLRKEIEDKTKAGETDVKTETESLKTLERKNEEIYKEINCYNLLSARIRESTNAYNQWMAAQKTENQGEMFSSAVKAFNFIKEVLTDPESENYGKIGTDDFLTAIGFVVPKEISDQGKEAVREYIGSLGEYFTDQGKGATGLNIGKFLDEAVNNGLMAFDETTQTYSIIGEKAIEEFAKGMDMSVPLVQAIFGELEEYGGNFKWQGFETLGDMAVSAAKAADKLWETEKIDVDLSFEGADDALTVIKQMNEIKAKPDVDVSEIEYANDIIRYCVAEMQRLNEPAIMRVDTGELNHADREITETLQDFVTASNDFDMKTSLGIDAADAENTLEEITKKIQGMDSTKLASLGIDVTSTETIKTSLEGMTLDEIAVVFGVDSEKIDAYAQKLGENDIKATVKYNVDTSEVDAFKEKNLSRNAVIYYHAAYVGNESNAGIPSLGGGAMASGGRAEGGKALVGEIGREIVVDPEKRKWRTVGENGAEFANLPKNAIVFNHRQTENLLKNGKVNSHGAALMEGNAYAWDWTETSGATVKASVSGSIGKIDFSQASSGKGGSKGSGKASAEKDSEKTDWIAVALSRIQRIISNIGKISDSVFKRLGVRLDAAERQMKNIGREMQLQEAGYARYMKEAESVGLESSLKERVQNGTIDINEYDKETQELIKDYQNWYEKALSCADAAEDLHKTLAELYKSDFEKVQTEYENRLTLMEHSLKAYESQAELMENRGFMASIDLMGRKMDIQRKNAEILGKKVEDLTLKFSRAMNSGEIEEYSEAWYDFQNGINEAKEGLNDAVNEMAALKKEIRETEWSRFDYLEERIGKITEESSFLIGLMENSELFEDNGQFTSIGTAAIGLRGANYNTAMHQAEDYGEEIRKIDKDIANDPYNTTLIERREELLKLQQDSITAAEDEKQAIKSLVKEGIDKELESLRKLIDKYNEALDSAKDLYDYQKNVQGKADEIGKIRKQITSYAGDDSEEMKATMQKLKTDLAAAEEELSQTEYERYISDQKKLLDKMYDDYSETLNKRLDDMDLLIADMTDVINANTGLIDNTLREVADDVGYTLSENISGIWENSTKGVTEAISVYGNDFSEKMTGIKAVLDGIGIKVANLANAGENAAKDNEMADSVNPVSNVVSAAENPLAAAVELPKAESATENAADNGNSGDRTDQDYYGVAMAIIEGASQYGWGNGRTRQANLESKGFNYAKTQGIINQLLKEGYISHGGWQGRYYGITDLSQYAMKRYRSGGLIDYTGLAQVDGSKTKPEMVLNAKDTENFIRLKDMLAKADIMPKLGNIGEIGDIAGFMPQNAGIDMGGVTMNVHIDHVEDYNDFVKQMQKDGQFEKMIQAMTVGRLAGEGSLGKFRNRI